MGPADIYIYIYIYTYIYPPAPTGHTAVRPFFAVLVSLLSRHHAIYCQVSILLSCVNWYSSSIAKILTGFFWFLCNCFLIAKSHGSVKIAVKNYVALNHTGSKTVCLQIFWDTWVRLVWQNKASQENIQSNHRNRYFRPTRTITECSKNTIGAQTDQSE